VCGTAVAVQASPMVAGRIAAMVNLCANWSRRKERAQWVSEVADSAGAPYAILEKRRSNQGSRSFSKTTKK
jgi:hypothetical protein